MLKLNQRSLTLLFTVALVAYLSNAGVMAIDLPARFAHLRHGINLSHWFSQALEMILAAGLAFVIDIHPSDEFKLRMARDGRSIEAFGAADPEAGGTDLSFVTAKVVDKNGTVVPATDNLIKFDVTGGSIAGVDTVTKSVVNHSRRVSGRLFTEWRWRSLKRNGNPDRSFRATADNLPPASDILNAR